MLKRKITALICALLLIAHCAYADTSVFVATDRHAHYETIAAEDEDHVAGPQGEAVPKPGAPRNKMPRKMPVYDSDGALIWHNNLTDVLSLVKQDSGAVHPSIVLLGGDNVGDGGDGSKDETGYPIGAPYFSMKSVDWQIISALGEGTRGLYTYGSHDKNETGSYTDAFFSGPVTCDGYYIYGISFAQMKFDSDDQAKSEDAGGKKYTGKDLSDPNGISAQTASHIFLSWVKGLDDNLPIIVMSHMPLHARRGDNLGAWTWTRALNEAAEKHDVFFLWGHNHTLEQNDAVKALEQANYLLLPGNPLTVQSWAFDKEGKVSARRENVSDSEGAAHETAEAESSEYELVTETETLNFVYMNAGYITNGVGTLLTFTGADEQWDTLTARRYSVFDEEQAGTVTFSLTKNSGQK